MNVFPGIPLPAQQGWQCPVCQTINAPWAATCFGANCSKRYLSTTGAACVVATPVLTVKGSCSVLCEDSVQLSLFNDLTSPPKPPK